MPDFGIFRGFNDKLFGNKLYAGQLPTQLGLIGSESIPLLLDSYPNASAAYSLRKLRSAYTGYAIKVRRASDNTEQDIGFSNNELDTTTLASFCSGTNGFVTTWYDQSGNGYNATQTTAANQPQIVSSGSVINVNSKPSLKFDGTNDFLLTSSSVNWQNSLSFFGIVKSTTGSYLKLFATAGDLPSSGYSISMYAGGSILDWQSGDLLIFGNGYNTTSYPRIISQGSIVNGNQQLISTNLNSTLSNAFINNTEITYRKQQSASLSDTDYPLYIGQSASNTLYYKDNIQELIFYTIDKSSDRTGISTNINMHYGIY